MSREYDFSNKSFKLIQKLAYKHMGISKEPMIYSLLVGRARKHKLVSLDDYCELLSKGDIAKIKEILNTITTNVTSFFREDHHFQYLLSKMLPSGGYLILGHSESLVGNHKNKLQSVCKTIYKKSTNAK